MQPDSDDRRWLGVAVTSVRYRAACTRIVGAAGLGDAGFHAVEGDGSAAFRWTDGCAMLPTPSSLGVRGACRVEVSLAHTLAYWVPDGTAGEAARAGAAARAG